VNTSQPNVQLKRLSRKLAKGSRAEPPELRAAAAEALATALLTLRSLDAMREARGRLSGDEARAAGALVRAVSKLAADLGLGVPPRKGRRAVEAAAANRELQAIVDAATSPTASEPTAPRASSEPEPTRRLKLKDLIGGR
jgi:hypothetical protein